MIRVKDSGAIPSGLPLPQIPALAALDAGVIAGAAAVAALVLIQGAGVAEAVPNPDGSTSSTRRDFTAQGLGNLASGFFGGQPVGGSVGQTALNVAAGARSRWAAIGSGLWMIAILLAFSTLVGEVAMPTLAAVLVYAGWGTIHPSEIMAVARAGVIPAIAMVATFALGAGPAGRPGRRRRRRGVPAAAAEPGGARPAAGPPGADPRGPDDGDGRAAHRRPG